MLLTYYYQVNLNKKNFWVKSPVTIKKMKKKAVLITEKLTQKFALYNWTVPHFSFVLPYTVRQFSFSDSFPLLIAHHFFVYFYVFLCFLEFVFNSSSSEMEKAKIGKREREKNNWAPITKHRPCFIIVTVVIIVWTKKLKKIYYCSSSMSTGSPLFFSDLSDSAIRTRRRWPQRRTP